MPQNRSLIYNPLFAGPVLRNASGQLAFRLRLARPERQKFDSCGWEVSPPNLAATHFPNNNVLAPSTLSVSRLIPIANSDDHETGRAS